MERYLGLDAHGQSCTFGVLGPSGRRIRHDVVETNGAALVQYVKSLPGRKHLCLEEGTQSAWLYEILSPHVEEIVVAGLYEKSRGPKDDLRDAFQRAEELRTNQVQTSVFKAPRSFAALRELSRVHTMLVRDVVRVQSRLKAMYRGRGIPVAGKTVYSPRGRESWLAKLPASGRAATARLYEEYDALVELKQAAEKEMLSEAAKQPIAKVLATAPGLGPIRTAQLLPVVVTPHRFRTRKQFWAYCGLAIVMRSSSDWVRTELEETMDASASGTGMREAPRKTQVAGPPGPHDHPGPLAPRRDARAVLRSEWGWGSTLYLPPPAIALGASAALLLATLAGAWYVWTDRYAVAQNSEQSFGLGAAPWTYPGAATEFILASGSSPHLFHEMSGGSYLAWKAQGRFPVYIDGRNEVFGEPFIAEYLAVAAGQRDWDAFADRWRINTALLHRERAAALIQQVQLSPRWALVHVDPRDVVFVRDIPEQAGMIGKLRVDPARPWTPRGPEPVETPPAWRRALGAVGRPWYTLGMAKSFLLIGSPDNASAYLERAHSEFPGDREVRATLAQIYRSRGREADADRLIEGMRFSPDEERRRSEMLADLDRMQGRIADAAAPLENAVRIAPDDAALRGKLARVYLESKDYVRAAEVYRAALRLAPANASFWAELGHACALQKSTDDALAAYRTSLQYAPAQFDIQYNVGILLARRGDLAGAQEAFRQSLRIRPDYEPAREALGRLGAAGAAGAAGSSGGEPGR